MTDSDKFDPYRKWLGIPPKDQPPNHYRLLGIELFESDPDVIESASDARMAHLRTFQTGKRSDLSQRLLNEIAAATTCLLNAEKKGQYDAHLRAEQKKAQPIPARAKPTPAVPPPKRSSAGDEAGDARTSDGGSPGIVALGTRSAPSVSTVRARTHRKKKSNALPVAMIVVGLVAVAVLAGLVVMLAGPGSGVADNGSDSHADAPDDGSSLDGPFGDDSHTVPDGPSPDDDNDAAGLPRVDGRELADASIARIDLLGVIDCEKDSIDGTWSLDAQSGLLQVESGQSRHVLQLPCRVPEGYRLIARVQRTEGQGPLALVLMAGGRQVRLSVDVQVSVDLQDGGFKPVTTLGLIDGRSRTVHEGQLLTPEKPRTLTCVVLPGRIVVLCDDALLADWRGEFAGLSLSHNEGPVLPTDRPHLEVLHAGMRIDELAIEPIAEPDKFVLPAPPEPDLDAGEDAPAPSVVRLPPPSSETLAAAKKLLGDVYKDALAEAKTSNAKIALAEKLLQDGREIDDDPVSRFALFDVARTLAEQQGAVAVAVEAIGELDGRFEVDGLALMIAAVQTGTKAARTGPVRLEAVRAALPVAQLAMDAGRYDVAIDMLNEAVNTAMRARDKKVTGQARELRLRAVALQKRWPEVRAAMEKLEQDPDDAAAAGLAGRFLVAAKGQWEEGLPLLAKSNDAELRRAARDDLKGPADAAARVELADRWMKIAEAGGEVDCDAFRVRAYHWYRAALPDLKGLARKNVEQILQESPDARTGPADPSTVADVHGLDVRKLEHRGAMLAVYGGDEKTEAAVAAALDWIAMHQNSDGSWSFNHQGNKCRARCADPGKTKSNIAATGVALMPLLGAGFDHRAGKHKGTVSRGIAFLGKSIRSGPTGASLADGGEEMFAHAFGTIALCESHGMTADKRLEPAARGLVGLIDVVQDPEQGGWARIPRDTGDDIRRFIWQIDALNAAKEARLEVPGKIGERAMRFLDVMQVGVQAGGDGDPKEEKDKDDDGPPATVGMPGAAYHLRMHEEEPTGQCDRSTAIGLLGRVYLGWKRDNPALAEGAAAIARRGPSETDIYYNFFATELMFHLGGPAWRKWNDRMKQILLDAQATGEHDVGSWYFDRATTDATDRGRLFSTALAAMILETYYRQEPLFDPPTPGETDTPDDENAEPAAGEATADGPAEGNGFDVRGFLEEE